MSARHWFRVGADTDLGADEALEFELTHEGRVVRGFVLAWQGGVYAYVNRCPHTGVELNWMPGRFFDVEGRYVQCAMHGALFEPHSGLCIHGPCLGRSLTPLALRRRHGEILVALPPEDEPPAAAPGD